MKKKIKDLIDLIDEGFSQTVLKEIDGRKLVIKKYGREKGFVKWLTIKLLNLPVSVYPYVLDPTVRMEREVNFMKKTEKVVPTPKPYLIDWVNKVVVRDYVEGTPLSLLNGEEYVLIGKTLFKIHNEGFALGDTKYSNFIIKDNVVYVIDSEQAVDNAKPCYMFWDIVVFLSTSLAKLTYGLNRVRKLNTFIEMLINGYVNEGDGKALEILTNYRRKNYWFASSTLIPFPYNLKFFEYINTVTKR